MASAQEDVIKTGNNALRQIGNQNGPWAVLFLLLIAGVLWYVHSEKQDCQKVVDALRNENNQLSAKNISIQVELANCQGSLNATKIEYNTPQTKQKRK